MSATNGHVPDGATIATLEMLRKANTTLVKCPSLSEKLGAEVLVRIRAIRSATYWDCLPPQPAAWKGFPDSGEERTAAYRAWHESLAPDELSAWRKQEHETAYRIIVAGVIEPVVTRETAEDFGADVDHLQQEILIFSGLVERPKPQEAIAA